MRITSRVKPSFILSEAAQHLEELAADEDRPSATGIGMIADHQYFLLRAENSEAPRRTPSLTIATVIGTDLAAQHVKEPLENFEWLHLKVGEQTEITVQQC